MPAGRAFGVVSSAIAVALALYVAWDVFTLLGRGFDLTDEAFYILWIAAPRSYEMSATFFAYLIHPLYTLLDGNIAVLRFLAAGLLIAGGAGAFWAVGPAGRADDVPTALVTPLVAGGLAIAAGVSQLVYYSYFWLPTPSYNWLVTLASLALLAALGLLTRQALYGSAILAAIAGVLALFAKPLSAPLFAAIYLLVLVITLRDWTAVLAQAARGAVACLVLLVLLAPFVAYDRVLEQALTYLPNASYLPSRRTVLYNFELLMRSEGPQIVAAGLLLIALFSERWSRRTRIVLMAALAVAVIWGSLPAIRSDALQPHLGTLLTLIAAFTVALARFLATSPERRAWLSVLGWAILIPWAASFGTGNTWQNQTSLHIGVACVVILAALCELRRWSAPAALVCAVALLAVTYREMSLATATPYRQATPIHAQNDRVTSGPLATLRLSPETAAFARTLRERAAEAGFTPGTPVIDLSGELPGVVVLLEGRAPVTPWILGGYDQSDWLLRFAVDNTPAEVRERAWLIEMSGPRSFAPELIDALGFDLNDGYRIAATAQHPLHNLPVRLLAPKGPATSPE